jgi:hypothetical protein
MKARISIIAFMLMALSVIGFSQNDNAKAYKDEQKAYKQRQEEEKKMKLDSLVSSREFVFVARTASPSSGRSVNLFSNPNFIRFHPEMIESEMPFFGTAYRGGYGTEPGMKFKGKPTIFTVKKGKKNWDVTAEVSDPIDRYKLYMTVTSSGTASLSISCNQKSTISYSGEISPINPESKK